MRIGDDSSASCPGGQHFDYDINECLPDIVYATNPQTGMPVIPPPATTGQVTSMVARYCAPGQVLSADGQTCSSSFPWWLVGLGVVSVVLISKKGGRR